ncbi:DUF5017 domain-containing protein [Niabella hibiscisoli]|uniref:DUF5017 domain-containing protein n=1 Tax=Niabella hibiscisoli TaxID=1825928 RepID=UPI001F10AFD3|nr:DUF5017 domain-containing protein [Niabella hibiscisoli]MCH5718383.1 DUF5017 domain-containing protein [Niabella hibiscisoli]
MRIYYSLIVSLLLVAGLWACKREIALSPSDFQVTTDSASYTRGGLTTFKFTGNPDNITFYSGSWGMRYQYANRFIDTSGTAILTFSTAVNTAGSSGELSLWYSTDYTNDTSRLGAASWTNVNSIAPIQWATTATATSSGAIDLTRLKSAGKPIYLAFKYTASAGATQRKWTITPLTLIHKPVNDTTYTILNLAGVNPVYAAGAPQLVSSPGWVAVNKSRNPTAAERWTPAASTNATTNFVIGGTTNTAIAVDTEQWLIAGPINLSQVLHDVPTAIVKTMSSVAAADLAPAYAFRYTLPGTYKAVFVGSSQNPDKGETTVRSVTIIVK